MDDIFNCSDVKKIDKLLWLSSPIFLKQNNSDMIYDEAVKIGKGIAANTNVNIHDVYSSITHLGIKEIVTFSSENILSEQDRAYYIPHSKSIQYNDILVEKLFLFCEKEKIIITKQEVLNTILLHELFHHLEECNYGTVDVTLSKKLGCRINRIYREIAAFAFVNYHIKTIKCQVIDLIWLKYTKYDIFEKLTKFFKTEKGG